jgi:hypothetical protein
VNGCQDCQGDNLCAEGKRLIDEFFAGDLEALADVFEHVVGVRPISIERKT